MSNEKLKFTFDESNGGHTYRIKCLAALNSVMFASGSDDEAIKIWNFNEGKLVKKFDKSNGGHKHTINSLVFLKNSGYLASASSDKNIKIWQI